LANSKINLVYDENTYYYNWTTANKKRPLKYYFMLFSNILVMHKNDLLVVRTTCLSQAAMN